MIRRPPRSTPLSLHDALPICRRRRERRGPGAAPALERRRVADGGAPARSEEHTSELQSQSNLVCRLLLEKKKIKGTGISTKELQRAHVVKRITGTGRSKAQSG